MKRPQILFAICSLMVFAGTAWSDSILVGTTDVGIIDGFIAAGTPAGSGDQTEIDWVNSVLLTSFTKADLTKVNMSVTPWQATNTADVFAFDFGSATPEYFYVKVGQTATGTHFLYSNLASLNWAVISLTEAGVEIENVGKLSHIGSVGDGGGGGQGGPEPAALILVGVGLVGIAALRKRRQA